MNNIKYVMLPRIEEKPKEIKPQPWFDYSTMPGPTYNVWMYF